ncbi:MAG: glycosyltransferase [Anaerolineae bacterium]|nr:glycosyltransferase [Anaerolineae bacterium]
MSLNRLAMLSVHTSPLASLGGDKTGGMNVYVKDLAQELGEKGIQIDIYTRRSDLDTPEVDHSIGTNVRVIHITAGPLRVLSPDDVYSHLSQFTAGVIAFTTRHQIQYDAIYSHYWLSGWVANKLKEVWGTPFVQMFHTLGHMKNRITPGYAPALTPDTRVATETQLMQWADRIVAATPAEYAQLRWLYRADRRKILIIPPGVNNRRFYPVPMAQAKEQLGIDPMTNLLLFVGRIEPLKAVDTILEALRLILKSSPDTLKSTKLVVIGGDPNNSADLQLARLKSITEQLGLTEIVQFIGAKNQDALHLYYAASLTVIMPSDYESFGMVALEAMASGTPVIASQIGGLAFLVEDGKSGFLVPTREPSALAERIQMLLNESNKLQYMRTAAAQRASQYSWSAIADQLLVVFGGLGNRTTTSIRRKH